MRFLSFSCMLSDDEVEVMEADEEDGDEMVETVDEVDERWRSMGDGLSFWWTDSVPWPFNGLCRLSCWFSR